MFNRLKKVMSKGFWQSLAVIIVMLLAGPEILVSMELMAMVEVLGASTFVLIYFSGLKLIISNVWNKYKNFERYSVFFFPTLPVLKQMPSMIIHAIPERTLTGTFLAVVTVTASIFYFQTLIGV